MHTRKVMLLLGAGLLVGQVHGLAAATPAYACDANNPCTPPPVIVEPGRGSGVGIWVNGPGSGGSGGAGGGGGVVQPVVQNGPVATNNNPFFPGSSPTNPLFPLGCPPNPTNAAWVAACNPTAPAAPGAPAAPPAPPPSIMLAQQAWGELTLPPPNPSRSPSGILKESGHPYTVVNADTWFWTDPATFQPVSKTVTAGTVWGKATATPVSLTFTPGDGSHPVTCKGPGQVWQPNDQVWLPPANPQGCSYQYPNSSLGVGGDDQVTATYTITWMVTWTGSDGTSGAFNGMQTQTASRFAVAEAQTVVVR